MILMLYTLDIQLLDLKGASSCSSGSLAIFKELLQKWQSSMTKFC